MMSNCSHVSTDCVLPFTLQQLGGNFTTCALLISLDWAWKRPVYASWCWFKLVHLLPSLQCVTLTC